ncbi:MAG TPA: hypothetical protein ENF89_02440 [Candidatus Bathyarchaeota archaeon]|nr:hypothetical protein [Candidatus Bathyarchaeota archaeon]
MGDSSATSPQPYRRGGIEGADAGHIADMETGELVSYQRWFNAEELHRAAELVETIFNPKTIRSDAYPDDSSSHLASPCSKQ